MPKNPSVLDATIYFADNGAALCGEHLGASAKITGRDLSGQEIQPITPELARESLDVYGCIPSCEVCGRKASLVSAAA